jgi:hypothetical protein
VRNLARPIPSAASLRISLPLARAVGLRPLYLPCALAAAIPHAVVPHHFALECSDRAENGEDQHSEWRSHPLRASLACLERQLRRRCGWCCRSCCGSADQMRCCGCGTVARKPNCNPPALLGCEVDANRSIMKPQGERDGAST